MRTTINLPDSLITQAKRVAIEKGTTLTELIADALRQALAGKRAGGARSVTPMPSYTPTPGMEGLQPGVDLSDTAALLDLMDEADAADRR